MIWLEEKQGTPIGGPIPLKDDRKPTVAEFLLIKVHIVEAWPLWSHVDHDVNEREHSIGLAYRKAWKMLVILKIQV